MNVYSDHEISLLPLTSKEKDHTSRTCLGIHVFISRFFYEYSLLNESDKLRIFNREEKSDADSLDSVQMPKVFEVFKLATAWWRSLSASLKDAWKLRAVELNKRPVPGQFIFIPLDVEEPELDSNVKRLLELDWRKFRKSMYFCVTRKPRGGISKQSYEFGGEKVTLHTQKYKEIYTNYLVRLALFGNKFRRLKETEIINHYPASTLLHFISNDRIIEVFTLASMCNMEFVHKVSKNIHSCCAKVNTRNKRTGSDMIVQ